MKDFLKNVRWFSQGALRIEYNSRVYYIDPFGIDKEYNDADFILISHPHFDHLSPEDIDKVIKADTVFLCPYSCSDDIDSYPNNIVDVYPDDVLALDDFDLSVVRAYNTVKTNCHPIENDWVGYVLQFKEITLYYTSDTELIPEMEDIETDIIFLPLGQTYTFESVEDAACAVVMTKAKIAVPIHFGLYEGTKEDVLLFEQILKGRAEVIVI